MKNWKVRIFGLSLILLAGTAGFGQDNTAYGTGALNTGAGIANSAFGYDALYNDTGSYNTATGFNALLENTSGNYNAATGESALINNTTGGYNTGMGMGALEENTTGNYNTATGLQALSSNTSANSSTANGYQALFSSTSCCNAALGASALYYVTTGQATTGVGNSAGRTADSSNITGKNNTFLGTGTALGTGTLTNATALGANAEVDASNSLVLGSINGVNGQTVTIKVGIGTTRPDNNLTVNGSADKPGGGSWGTYSDGRLKTLHGRFDTGLNKILQINPVRYRYTENNALGIRDADEHVGLVAQDVEKVIPEAVTANSRGYLLINNDPIIWAMLNAIKEQQSLIQKQRRQIRDQQAQLEAQQSQIKAQRTQGQIQQAQVAELAMQVKAIRTSLNPNAGTSAAIRSVKAEPSLGQ